MHSSCGADSVGWLSRVKCCHVTNLSLVAVKITDSALDATTVIYV
jgi:hypothetical protein